MELDHFFERLPCQATLDGCLVVSSLNLLQTGLQHFIQTGLINTKNLFCDAGCGDGRVVALAARIYQIPSIGIESDPEIVKIAKRKIYQLKEQGKIEAKIIEGNFVQDKTYQQAGINFREIKTFFNYVNNQNQIAARIAQLSPKGTVFLLYDSDPIPEDFTGLEFNETKRLDDEKLCGAPYYLHAYKKNNSFV